MRSLPAVRSYSYLLNTVPGMTSNITDVNTGPVFAIFPVHGGRGVESRLTGRGHEHQQPALEATSRRTIRPISATPRKCQC
jgi:hypothetical protein